MRGLFLAVLISLVSATQVSAWGAAGHAIVAEIAQRRLRPEALAAAKQLLGGERSLASVSSWADTIGMARPETRTWHFVNIPVGSGAYDPARDCKGGQCVVAAIARQRLLLRDRAAPTAARAEALKFLIHLVADIHQPLHCAERDGDAGATTLPVVFGGEVTNLHLVWDVKLIESVGFDWGALADRLQNLPTASDDQEGEPADWAWQCHRLAVSHAYPPGPGGVLTQEYRAAAVGVVERQLLRAAVRLARVLNDALAP